MALLDKINQQRQAQPQQQLGQTEAVNKLLQAKSGKAATTGAPVDTTAEAALADQVRGEQRAMSQAAALEGVQAAQQSAGIAQQAGQAADNLQMAKKSMEANRDRILADLQMRAAQEAEKLGLNKQEAAMQARLFEKRLTNEKYLQELAQEGNIKRLKDERSFRLAMQEQIFGRDLALMLDGQEFQGALNMGNRDFQEWLNTISLKDAWKLTTAAIKQQTTAQTMSAFTGGLQAGMSAGSLTKGSTPAQTSTPTGTSTQYNEPSSNVALS
jgi:hypothetical protein